MGVFTMKKHICTAIIFFNLNIFAQLSENLTSHFCSTISIKNTLHCTQDIHQFLQNLIKEREENSPSFISLITGGGHPPIHIMHNKIKDKAIDFCTRNQSINTFESTEDCIRKTKRFLHLIMRMTEVHSGTTTASDITREFDFMDSSTWNPGFIDFNLPQFYSYIESTEYCIQDTNALLKKISLTIDKINNSQIKSICSSLNINNYVYCRNTKKDIMTSIQSIIHSAQNTVCSKPDSMEDTIKELKSVLKPLQNEYAILSEANRTISIRHDYFIQTTKTNKENVEENKIPWCRSNLRQAHTGIIVEFTAHNILKIEKGDLYKINKSLNKCKILLDQMSNLSQICDLQDLSRLEDAKQMVTQFENNFGHDSIFEQTSKYACETLNQSDIGAVLCENPIDNPSWIYSAHYFLENL